MADIVLMGDPRVAAIPVTPVDDPLVDFRGSFLVSSLKDDDNSTLSYLRSELVTRLSGAQAHLPDGYDFLLVEGFRPFELQEHYFSSYRDELQSMDGQLSVEESFQLASRHVSPPQIAPHVSGAAIDLSMVVRDGTECDMGTAINATPEDSKGACYFAATNISTEARHHRAILARALNEVELINYPTEWWHWSYGDRYWAFATQQPSALYGPISQVGRGFELSTVADD